MIGARKLRCRSGPNDHATSLRGITEGNGKRETTDILEDGSGASGIPTVELCE